VSWLPTSRAGALADTQRVHCQRARSCGIELSQPAMQPACLRMGVCGPGMARGVAITARRCGCHSRVAVGRWGTRMEDHKGGLVGRWLTPFPRRGFARRAPEAVGTVRRPLRPPPRVPEGVTDGSPALAIAQVRAQH